MNYVVYKPQRFIRWFLLAVALLLLSACRTTQPPAQATNADTFDRIASVTVEPGLTKAEVAARYGGDVILFDDEEGFAVLGFNDSAAEPTLLSLSTLSFEDNVDTFLSPEVTSQGARAWAGGARAWAGGRSTWAGGARAWAGGRSTWAGGRSTWAGGAGEGTPMDNYEAWEQIGLYEAHTTYAPLLGQDVVVAVIDSGLDLNHPVFEDRLVDGWDFLDNDAIPQDEGEGANYGHGTAVAGVILQVAPQAKIMPLRILDATGAGDTDDLVLAIDWAIEHGADIINMSLGSTEGSEAVEFVMKKAKDADIAMVASAGNTGDENVTFPAWGALTEGDYKDALVSVGSVNDVDEKSDFSTYHEDKLETVAPGEAIFTAYPDEQVIYWSGTSFAAPMVSGALALAMAEPTLDKPVKDLAKKVADKVSDDLYDIPYNKDNFDDALGKGRLDLIAFLDDVLDVD